MLLETSKRTGSSGQVARPSSKDTSATLSAKLASSGPVEGLIKRVLDIRD